MILVFGQNGQVATELRAFAGVKALGRQQVDLSDPQASASVILSYVFGGYQCGSLHVCR